MPGRVEDHEFVAHGGGINGFNSYASHLPALDVTIVVLANGPTNAARLHERITRAVLGLPMPVEQPAAADVPIAEEELARYTGTYDLSPTVPVQVRVFVSDGRLMGQGTGQAAFPLRFVGDHTFEAPEGLGIRMVFAVEDGRATSFTLHQAGPLIGTRTWGGLVRSCSHYPMIDGGFITSPCNAVFQPGVGWIAENEGVPPDIEVRMDARSVAQGRDPQLERAVQEALRMLDEQGPRTITVPAFPRPAGWPPGGSSNPRNGINR